MHLSVINPSTCTCTTVLYFNEVHLLVSVISEEGLLALVCFYLTLRFCVAGKSHGRAM